MRPFFSIVKLTMRNAFRSHIFQLLLGVLLLCVVVIPNVVSAGDGSAAEFIRISLLYSTSAVALVLALSSVWLGCYAMNHDVENYQLHMVISKPISRPAIWLAKWFGVALLHLILLFLAGTVIYAIIMVQFQRRDFSPEDRARVEAEVLVGRRVYMPDQPDVEMLAREALREKIAKREAAGESVDVSPQAQDKMLADMRREILGGLSSLPVGYQRNWTFSRIKAMPDAPLYLRYRVYVGRVATEGQRMTHGWWQAGVVRPAEGKPAENVFAKDKPPFEIFMTYWEPQPTQFMSGDFHEKKLPPWKLVSPEGKIVMGYVNFDGPEATQYFQVEDGPRLLTKVCGFAANYYRGLLVIALELMVLAGLGCAAGGILTLPTAIFVVVSYILFGSFAGYMGQTTFFGNAADYLAYYVSKGVLLVVIPVQEFGISELLSKGELIEFSFIGWLFFSYILLRALPLFLFGIYFYWRREMGLVVRK